MDAELKTKWLSALRSGRYKQSHTYLKSTKGYCCLGVLAQIQGAEWKDGAPFIKGKLASHELKQSSYLLPSFAGGLRAKTQTSLAERNDGYMEDGKQWSFKEIADYIEKYL